MASAERTRQTDFDAVIGSGDENHIVDALDAVARSHAFSAERSRIIEFAGETRSPKVRNTAAIALADLGVDGADQLLIDLIKRTSCEARTARCSRPLEIPDPQIRPLSAQR